MKNAKIKETVTVKDSENNMHLTYSVIISEDTGEYGISVLKECGGERECEITENISSSFEKVLSLAHLLARNTVTPVSFKDVVYDFLCEM